MAEYRCVSLGQVPFMKSEIWVWYTLTRCMTDKNNYANTGDFCEDIRLSSLIGQMPRKDAHNYVEAILQK